MDSRLIFLHFCTVAWSLRRGNRHGLWNVRVGVRRRALWQIRALPERANVEHDQPPILRERGGRRAVSARKPPFALTVRKPYRKPTQVDSCGMQQDERENPR